MSRKSILKKKLEEQTKRKNEPTTAVCDSCRTEFLKKNMTFGEDPFRSEIFNNKAKVWLCDHCYKESYMDI